MNSIKEEVTQAEAVGFCNEAFRNMDVEIYGDDMVDIVAALNDFRLQSTSGLRAKAEGLAEQVLGVLYMLAEAPEINPANYTDDDVCEQNRVLNEAHASLRAILAKHGDQSQ